MLFPTLVGAISLDKSSYSADQTLVIPNVLGSGGRFYNLTVPDFVVTINGWSEAYDLPADFLIPGEYVLVDTNNSDVCSNLTLEECRADSGFLNEKSFSISFDGEAPVPTIDIIDSGATPLAPLSNSAPVVPTPELTPTSTPALTPEPVIQENADGSATLIAI